MQSDEPFRVPKNWSPYIDEFDPTYLYIEQGLISLYYRNVYLANWRKWYEKCEIEAPTSISENFALIGENQPKLDVKDLAKVSAYD